ncbi:hypothetical protein ACIRF8_12690 [Streptomyces sp. NPDC102406]|uniref:hypothetical protein n=1 Tax=Streptomyces sp. NPDC102406 TaxID=3366171 RepID=UPI0038065968
MSTSRDATRDQPLPTPGQQPVQDALIGAVQERRAYGIRKYGRPLETHNGRDALTDAWEEALDLVTYLTQMRLERGDELPTAAPADQHSLRDVMGPADGQQKMRLLDRLYANTSPLTEPADTGLHERVVQALAAYDFAYFSERRQHEVADAVLAVLPAPADRAAVLREAADRLHEMRMSEREWLPATGLHKGELELRHMSDEAQKEEPEPIQLRWGLDDVMYGDDDTTTVMLSGPGGEPYWLELDPERAAVLRQDLAGPDTEADEAQQAKPAGESHP